MFKPFKTLVLSSSLLLFASAASAETLVKLSHQWRQGDPRHTTAEYFIEEAKKRTTGLNFRIYPARSLVSDPIAQFDALVNRTIEMAIYPIAYAEGKVPEFSIGGMPATVKNLDHAMRLRDSEFAEKMQEIAHRNGVHMVSWWWITGGFASKNREIAGPETVRGLRMRGGGRYYEALLVEAGASVQSMPSTEIYPAMQTGVIDAVLTSSDSFVSMRLYEQATHATVGGNSLFMVFMPLLVSKPFWDGLTPEQQAGLTEAGRLSDEVFTSNSAAADKTMIDTFGRNGVEVRPLADDEYRQWLELGRTTAWKMFAEDAPQGQELLDLIAKVD